MLTMLRNNQMRSDSFGDLISQASGDTHPVDHLSCPMHPGFKLQGLCPEETYPSLLCIKCMIDPEIEKRVKFETVVAIQDVINRVTVINEMEAQVQIDRDTLKNTILEFGSKDYLRSFERHVDSQMKKLHREIQRTKDSLDEMEVQFKRLFEKQQKHLQMREDELKQRINEYVADQDELKQFLNLTPQQIMEAIRKISTIKEYERFLRVLYQRGSPDQRAIQTSMIKGITEVMEDLSDKVTKMKNFKIQTSLLEGKFLV